MKDLKTIKINFKHFYKTFNPEKNFFTDFLRRDYNVVLSNKPDFVIYSVFDGRPPAYDEDGNRVFKMPVLTGDFVKIFYTGENCRPDMENCDYAFTFDYDEELKHPRHLRLPLYKLWMGAAEGSEEILVKKAIDAEGIKRRKNKFCNFIYANDIEVRNRFFQRLSQYKKVDSAGSLLNNISLIFYMKNKLKFMKQHKFARRIAGLLGKKGVTGYVTQNKKAKFLNSYKFTIAFENSSYPGYTTEKIYQAMLANSIPIYWGNPLIGRDFNTKSFLNYHDFKSEEELVEKIAEIDKNNDLYEQYLREPWYHDNKPSKYVDSKRIAERFREIFQQ